MAAAVLLAVGMNYTAATLPRPAFTSTGHLPDDFVPVQATYHDEIRLLGYAGYDSDLAPGGYLVVELYWQALRPPAADYVVTFRIQNNQTGNIDQVVNTQLGTHSTPTRLPQSWPVGEVYYERYLFDLPGVTTGTPPVSFDLLVGLYDTATHALLPVTAADHAVIDHHLRITGTGIWAAAPTASAPPVQVAWDDALSLSDFTCTTGAAGLEVTLDWYTRARPTQTWHIFIHVRPGDTTIAQHDAPPVALHPTDSWSPGSALRTTWNAPTVTAPAPLYVGFYDPFTLERVPITASQWPTDNDAVIIDCAEQSR